jgi:Ankyrin repeats (many copies)
MHTSFIRSFDVHENYRYITNCDFHNRVLQAIGSRGDLFQSRKKFSEVGSDAFIEELRHLIEEFESRVEDFKRISEQWPFLEYAGTNWCKHVDYSKGRVALREFPWTYNEESAIFKAWISLNSLEGGRVLTVTTEGADLDLEELVRFEPVNLAHVAAYAGLRHLCFQVLSMKPNSVRAAFAVACYQGHLRMVQDMVLKLQDRVIGPNASILEAAMRTSLTEHTVIVEELLSVQNRLGDPESPEFKLPATMVMIGGCLFGSIEHIRLAWLSLGSPSVVYIDLDWVITIVAMDSRSGNGGKPQDPRTEKLEVPKMIATINNLTSWSPFMIAALSDHQETIQYTVQEKLFGESATSEISFAFQICAFLGSSDTFRFLLSLPFDEIPTGPALTATILSGNIEFAEILLEDQETWTELVLVGNQIKTAIGLAATTEYLEMAQLLHAKGANWTTKDGIGRTALHWAADFGQEDMVNWLLTMASPEEVAIVDRRGDSALDIAVRHGHTSILEKLAQGLASSDLSLR